MEAQTIYVRLMRLALKSSTILSRRRIMEINSGIGELRQLLSCVVCCQLLMDPYKPKGRRCNHHVCRLCLRGAKRLFPTCLQCIDCSDFKTYEENKIMALQLVCYKMFCVHLLQSALYGQLAGKRPEYFMPYKVVRQSRIKLPDKSTQWFIHEGAKYDDMCDSFLAQPDLSALQHFPSSLPAETPPTTAATTPELPYEQNMPDHLSLSHIELEAAATGDEAEYTHQLPLMASGARMLTHRHIAPQQQMLVPAGYIESGWTEQVDMSGAYSLPYGHTSSNYTTYMVPRDELHMSTLGQLVQIPADRMATATLESTMLEALPMENTTLETTVEPVILESTTMEPPTFQPIMIRKPNLESETLLVSNTSQISHKRSLAEMMAGDVVAHEEITIPSTTAAVPDRMITRSNLRNQKPIIISSVQIKPPSAVPIVTAPAPQIVSSSAAPIFAVPASPIVAASHAPPHATATFVRATARHPIVAAKKTIPVAAATSQSVAAATSQSVAATIPLAVPAATPSVVATSLSSTAQSTMFAAKSKSTSSSSLHKVKDPRLAHICRCGTTSAPGNATCRNNRCTCYIAGKSCLNCKCIGCKNPHSDAPGSTDDDDEEEENVMETIPATESTIEPTAKEDSNTTQQGLPEQSGVYLVLLENLEQSEHALILIENEHGQYQGFNIFNGKEPMDPELAGFQRVTLRSNDGHSSLPVYAYVMPTASMLQTTQSVEKTLLPTVNEQIQKMFKSAMNMGTLSTSTTVSHYSSIESVEEFVSANANNNAAAGDSLNTDVATGHTTFDDKAHILFEDIMTSSDDL